MPTQIRVTSEQTDRIVSKIIVIGPQQMIVKSVENGAELLENCDFRNHDLNISASYETDYPRTGALRVVGIGNGDIFFEVRTLTDTWPTPLDDDQLGPKHRRTYTLPSGQTYPYYILFNDQETATPEDAARFVVPSWIPEGLTALDFIEEQKIYVGECADVFDDGLHGQWKELPETVADTTAEQAVVSKKYSNIEKWGRLLIGYLWRELYRLNSTSTVAADFVRVQSQIAKLRLQLPQMTDVAKKYKTHNYTLWEPVVRDADDSGSRQIRLMTESGEIGELIYDLNVANTANDVLDANAAAAEYKDIIINQYDAALNLVV